MAAFPLVSGVWRTIPIVASSGTITVVNPTAFPMYVVAFQGATQWVTFMKVQPTSSNSFFVPAGFSTIQAVMFRNGTPDLVAF